MTNVRRASRLEIKCLLSSVVFSAAVTTIFNVFLILNSFPDERGHDENKTNKLLLTHRPWPRVVSDESVACRLYDLPMISGVSNLPRLPPLKCETASKDRPWVRVVGNVALLDSNMVQENSTVVCSFEGTVLHHDPKLGFLPLHDCLPSFQSKQ
jgi:hypothetical protein